MGPLGILGYVLLGPSGYNGYAGTYSWILLGMRGTRTRVVSAGTCGFGDMHFWVSEGMLDSCTRI